MTPLHAFGDALREGLLAIPLSAVRGLFVALLVGLLIWVLWLPAKATQPPGGAKRFDENLKWGAAIAILIQIMIYSLL
ncbi:MAG: hypothetical protein EA381_19995 [Planctomycetaceae bacterium]|nr:MAG: hypothetical protein EA381_19995 [Planctomycetaceae bacterium]